MNHLRGAVGLMIFSAAPLFAAELTLQQAVNEALERNPQVRIASAQQRASVAAQKETRSTWLPRADVSETIIRSNNPVFVFGSLLEQGRFGEANFDPQFLNSPPTLQNYRLALNLRYTLFDQFRRLEATRQAANAVAQSDAASEEAKQAIRVDVMSKFYGLLVAESRRDVAADAVKTAENDAAMMRDKFKQGLLVESDALAAEVQVASFRQQLIEAEGGVAIARASLNAAIGRDTTADTIARGELPEANRQPEAVEALLERGRARRGDVAAAQLGTSNARLQMQVARGSFLPRVDTFATWGASGPRFADRNGDHSIGAVVSFDLFDGGRYPRVAQAAANVDRARAAEDAERSKVEVEIVSAQEHVRSAVERIAVASAAVNQATAAARIVRDRYEQGLTTITEHLRAQTALVGAKLNLLTARYDYVIGSADLARATGDLHDVSQTF